VHRQREAALLYGVQQAIDEAAYCGGIAEADVEGVGARGVGDERGGEKCSGFNRVRELGADLPSGNLGYCGGTAVLGACGGIVVEVGAEGKELIGVSPGDDTGVGVWH